MTSVWVITREDFSGEGLEGVFDVFVGIAASPLEALAVVESSSGTWGNFEIRYSIGLGSGANCDYDYLTDDNAVTLERLCYKHGWVNGQQVRYEDSAYWSHVQTWHIRELEM